MAARGTKPTATVLKLVTGKPGHRPLPKDEPQPKGPLGKRPRYLKGRARALWDEVSRLAWWLGDVDRYKLGLWCELQAESEEDARSMIPSRIAQLRALGSELGFDPASRTRMEGLGGYGKHPSKPTPPGKDPYFD